MSGVRIGRLSVGVVACALAGAVFLMQGGLIRGQNTADEAAAVEHAKSLSTAFRAAAKEVLPTVVKIRTVASADPVDATTREENPFRGTPWEPFFDDESPGPGWRRMPRQPQPGLGSGVIIDPSGVVLTNNHVVEGADTVFVQMGDGTKYEAVEILTDQRTDLAVVRIKPNESLPAARLGNSDKLEIGDWVIAVGNPFELERTVSAGIISAKGRSLGRVGRANFLQTDAAINPGNSGGPLVNLDGEVVGINTAIFSRSGGYQGIGFAIPSNVAKWVTPQLINGGVVKRAYLGVQIADITGEDAGQFGVRPYQGVAVGGVSADSPADKAGLEQNDVILTFDGAPIRRASDLQRLVERSSADSRHRIEILRDGEPKTIQVVVAAMPDTFGEASFLEGGPEFEGPTEMFHSDALGLAAVNLSETMAEQLGLRETAGALVVRVDPRGLAYQAGLREGMVVVRVGDAAVENVRGLRAALAKASLPRGITLEVRTRSGSRTITIQSS